MNLKLLPYFQIVGSVLLCAYETYFFGSSFFDLCASLRVYIQSLRFRERSLQLRERLFCENNLSDDFAKDCLDFAEIGHEVIEMKCVD